MITLANLQAPVSTVVGPAAEYYSIHFPNCQAIDLKSILTLLPILDNRNKAQFIGLNCGIPYMISKDILDRLPTLNIHPSALPLNRGSHQSFWSIMNNEQHGATLHWMEVELDSGPIIAQKVFKCDPISTAEEVQNTSAALCLDLVRENIIEILNSNSLPTGKPQLNGTSHKKKELRKAACIEEDELISGKRVLQLARATCANENGFYITRNGKLVGRIVISNIDKLW